MKYIHGGLTAPPRPPTEKLIHESFAHGYINIGNSSYNKKRRELKVLRIYAVSTLAQRHTTSNPFEGFQKFQGRSAL